MKINRVLLLGLVLVKSVFVAVSQERCVPVGMLCEYLSNPLGIDALHPRLRWHLDDVRDKAMQKACRVLVSTDSLKLADKNYADCWDTGKRKTETMQFVYNGKKLLPFTKYFWKVEVWDKDGNKTSSDIASFETGMLEMHNWRGSWISDGRDMDYKPAPYFRKEFVVNKSIYSARAYIAVAGLYELYMNGQKVGNHRLDPMYTRFDRRNLYVTYDVTKLIQEGKNAIGVLLGNGWYNHRSIAVWDFHHAPWRNRPAFCMDLHIMYADGTKDIICTDRDWRTREGGLLFNSIYTGEHYDAQAELDGWNLPGYDDSTWRESSYRSVPSTCLTAQQLHPIRSVETYVARRMTSLSDSVYVFDFGQNMSGVTSLKVTGEKGTVIRLKHGERLYSNGRVNTSNIDVYHRPVDDSDPFQTDIIILKGQGEEEFMPKFNYKGFRYVEVISSHPIKLNERSLTAYFVHSDVPQVGFIQSSDTIINRLWRATNKAYLSNLMGYPTDCPQREKNGWTGDAHFAIETALYNYDGITVYEKWLADHRDEQQPNGVLPDIIPTGGWGYGTDNGLDWTSTIAIIPWNLYLFYGDLKPLTDCYEAIKKYVDYAERKSIGRLTDWGRGDWVPVKSHSSKELTSSTYFYVDAKILSETAKLLGKKEDYLYYSKLAEEIKQAINAKYLNYETGVYASGTQTEQSVPLMWGVTPEHMKRKVAHNLACKVRECGFHLDVGVLGAKALLNALSENGEAETAYRLAVQDTYPSWGNWVANGATTLLENWDLNATRDISDNHMMFGEIGGWLYKGLGGIYPDVKFPGFKHIILKPYVPRDLKQFEATYHSSYGKIYSGWEQVNGKITYKVIVPPNSTATLYLPDNLSGDDKSIELESGTYIFDLKFKE